jgi:hypothetical protein
MIVLYFIGIGLAFLAQHNRTIKQKETLNN